MKESLIIFNMMQILVYYKSRLLESIFYGRLYE